MIVLWHGQMQIVQYEICWKRVIGTSIGHVHSLRNSPNFMKEEHSLKILRYWLSTFYGAFIIIVIIGRCVCI